jgi:hypothetical protein
MLGCVALVRTNVSEELNASFIRVTIIGELGKTLVITSNRRTLRRNTKSLGISSQGASVGDYEEWRLLGCYGAHDSCKTRRFGGT